MPNPKKKCANPACTCIPRHGDKYCGAHCEALGGAVEAEVVCRCAHPSCQGDPLSPASPRQKKAQK